MGGLVFGDSPTLRELEAWELKRIDGHGFARCFGVFEASILMAATQCYNLHMWLTSCRDLDLHYSHTTTHSTTHVVWL
jgi:hypothetical protein